MDYTKYFSNYKVEEDIKPRVDFDFTMECLRKGKVGETLSFKEEIRKMLQALRMKGGVYVRYVKEEPEKVKSIILTFVNADRGVKSKDKAIRPVIVNNDEKMTELLNLVKDFTIEYCSETEKWFHCKVNEKVATVSDVGMSKEEILSYAKRQCLNLSYESYLKDLENSKMEEKIMTKEERETKQAEKYAMEPVMKYLEREGMKQTEGKETPVELVEECENAILEEDIEVSEDTYEDGVAVDDEITQILEEVEKEEEDWKEKKNQFLHQCKIDKVESCEAVVGISNDYSYQIVVRALGDGRQRKYNIYERKYGDANGRRPGFLHEDNTFSVSVVKGEPLQIKNLIDNFRGNYHGKKNLIISKIQLLEEERLFDIYELEADEDVDDLVEKFKEFMLDNPLTSGFVHFEIDKIMEVGIVGDKKVFDEILERALPGCTRKKFNGILKAKKLLKITGNTSLNDCYKCTRTICPNTKKKQGLLTGKIYNFNFGDDFVKEYVKAYNEANKKMKGKN